MSRRVHPRVLGLFTFTCAFLLNVTTVLAQCTDLASGYYNWVSHLGNVMAVDQTGSNVSGYVTTTCGNLNFTGTIESSGQIELFTTHGCNVQNPGEMILATLTLTASPSMWNWWNKNDIHLNNEPRPLNCDSVHLHWVGFSSNGPPPEGEFYFLTFAENESTSSGLGWASHNISNGIGTGYAWKATALGSHGRHFAGRQFYEDDPNPLGSNDTCHFTGSLVPAYNGLPKVVGPNSWDQFLLGEDSSWQDVVGWRNYAATYYRQNPYSSTMSTYGYCGVQFTQVVWMVADWTYTPETYNHAVWTDGTTRVIYKYNQNYAEIDDARGDYYSSFNGENTWWHMLSKRDGSANYRYNFWPRVHPPTVSVSNVASSAVTFSLVNDDNAIDANGYLVWRWNGNNFEQILDFGVSNALTDDTVVSGETYTYCVRAAKYSGNLPTGQFLWPTSGPCPNTLTVVTIP